MLNYSEIDIPSGLVVAFSGGTQYESILKNIILQKCPAVKFVSVTPEQKKPQKKGKGIISKFWLNKILYSPSVIIIITDISDFIRCGITNDEIAGSIYKGIQEIAIERSNPPFILVIVNETNNSSFSNIVRNKLMTLDVNSERQFLNDFNIFMIYNKESLEYGTFVQNFIDSVYNQSKFFYNEKKKRYKRMLKNQHDQSPEIIAKICFKLGVLSFLIHVEGKNYSYFKQAYEIMTKSIPKVNYLYNTLLGDIRSAYLEIRNVCDWLLVFLVENKELSTVQIESMLIEHFAYFNIDTFINCDGILCEEMRIMYYIWKWKLCTFINEKLLSNTISSLEINSLIRLVDVLGKTTIEETQLNYEQFACENSGYEEKLPFYFNSTTAEFIDDINVSIALYYNDYVKRNKIEVNLLKKMLKEILISKMNSKSEYFYNIIRLKGDLFLPEELKVLYEKLFENQHLLRLYPKVCLDLLERYQKLTDRNEKDILLSLLTISEFRTINKEEIERINSLFQSIQEIPEEITLKTSNIFQVEYDFDNYTPSFFDTTEISLKVKAIEGINIKISKVSIAFNHQDFNKEIVFEEERELSSTRPLEVKGHLFSLSNSEEGFYPNSVTLITSKKIEITLVTVFDQEKVVFPKIEKEKIFTLIHDEEVTVGLNTYYLYKIRIKQNEKYKNLKIKSTFTSISLLNGPMSRIPDSEFAYLNESNQVIKNKNSLSFKSFSPSDLSFSNRVSQKGKFIMNVKSILTIINEKYPKEDISLIEQIQIRVNVIQGLEVSSSIDTNILMIQQKSAVCLPLNKRILVQIKIENKTEKNIVLTSVATKSAKEFISLTSPISKLLPMTLPMLSTSLVPFYIISSKDFSGIPGDFTITWQNEDLQEYSEKINNQIHMKFDEIYVKNFEIGVTGTFLSKGSVLKISIENLSDCFREVNLTLNNQTMNNELFISGFTSRNLGLLPRRTKTLEFYIRKTSHNSLVKFPSFMIKFASDNIEDPDTKSIKTIIYHQNYVNINGN